MYRVYGRATSSNVQCLLWGLEELGLDYERLDYGGEFGGLDTAEFRKLNPHGRIPVLQIGDQALFESAAILRYLAARHGSESFWPSDSVGRAKVDMWAEWAKWSVADNFTVPVFWLNTRTAPERRDPARIRANLARLEAELEKAEPILRQSAYLCGEELSLADIHFGHILYRYFYTDLDRRDLPELGSYYARLCARPAFVKTVMVSYDSLRNTF